MPLKAGVTIAKWTPQIVFALMEIRFIFDELGVEFWVTSGDDSKHRAVHSKHYEGNAADIRLPSRYSNRPGLDKLVTERIRDSLGALYDVVLEVDHIHVEYDPPVPGGNQT